MKVAISITTHNRYDVFLKTYKSIKKYLPKGARLVVIDDGSEIPVQEADFRFETAQGIAAAKNKSFELMGDADYYFCFDDDVQVIKKDWHLPYIESGINHLCFTFAKHADGTPNGRGFIKTENGISYYRSPCGCMLFFTRACLYKVGGMDEDYGRWSMEHCGLSMRIHNAGLTKYPFMDIANSLDYFSSEDYHKSCVRSVPTAERMALIRKNQMKYQREIKSSSYIPFKQQTGVVLTTYLTGCVDPQRGQKWEADIEQVRTLSESVKKHNTKLVVLNDCFGSKEIISFNDSINYDINFQHAASTYYNNPYFWRWLEYREYLKHNKADNVFLTDCNDVELLRHPFRTIQPGKLYVGWEKEFIGCQWMLNHHKSNFSQTFIRCNMKTPLLNAGVIGGRYDIVMEFLDRICDMIGILPELSLEDTDMSLFNWVLYSHFNGRFEAGPSVTTTFKAFDYKNKQAIWRHK